ncbi:hypothetical protein ACWEAF_05760 [Streptomyces sp. NPDC005071]
MTRTPYSFESLAPSWLVHDAGYRAGLTQHMRDRMTAQGYAIVSPVRIRDAKGDVPPPVGWRLLSVEVEVEEFDIDMGDGDG